MLSSNGRMCVCIILFSFEKAPVGMACKIRSNSPGAIFHRRGVSGKPRVIHIIFLAPHSVLAIADFTVGNVGDNLVPAPPLASWFRPAAASNASQLALYLISRVLLCCIRSFRSEQLVWINGQQLLSLFLIIQKCTMSKDWPDQGLWREDHGAGRFQWNSVG